MLWIMIRLMINVNNERTFNVPCIKAVCPKCGKKADIDIDNNNSEVLVYIVCKDNCEKFFRVI